MPKEYCIDCGFETIQHKECRKCGLPLCIVCFKNHDKLCVTCCDEEDNGYLIPNRDNSYAGFE